MRPKITHEIKVSQDEIFKLAKAETFAKFSGDLEKMQHYTMQGEHRRWFDNYIKDSIGDLQSLIASFRSKCEMTLPKMDSSTISVMLTLDADYPLAEDSIDAIALLIKEIISHKVLMAWFTTQALPELVTGYAGIFEQTCSQLQQLCLSLWYQNHSHRFYSTDNF